MSPSHASGRTPLHHWHTAGGARFTASDGWQIPMSYTNVEQEIAAARASLGLADLSAFAKVSLLGRGVPALTHSLLGDGPASKPRGVAQLDAGGPVLACRLTEDHLLLLASTTSPIALQERLAKEAADASILQHDVTSAYAGFGLVGPRTEDVLRHLTALDVAPAALPIGSCAETSLAGVHTLLVRPPQVTLPRIHVYVSWDLGEYVWEQLLDTRRSFGLAPLGLEGWRRISSES